MRCKECLNDDVKDGWCDHCLICGDDGVSHDPRFQRGGWCDICKAKDDLENAQKTRDGRED